MSTAARGSAPGAASGCDLRWLRQPKHRFRRRVALLLAASNRLVDRVFAGDWSRRRLERSLELHEVPISLRRGGPGLDGLRIAFLSDAHAGFVMDAALLERIAARVMAAAPDLVCIGGDLIDTRRQELQLWRPALARLQAPLGVYAVPGNHEYLPRRPELGAWREFLAAQNVRVLWNDGVRITRGRSSLWLAGIDDPGAGEPDLAAALAGRAPDEPTLLLAHHPDVFCHSRTLQVDLQLSGHTHGGQILLFGWAPITHSRFGWWRGHHAVDGAQLYVGRGVGVTLLPLRIGVRNEVPLLVLRTGARR